MYHMDIQNCVCICHSINCNCKTIVTGASVAVPTARLMSFFGHVISVWCSLGIFSLLLSLVNPLANWCPELCVTDVVFKH